MIELTVALMQRIIAIVVVTPLFIIPSIIMAAIGTWCGRLYAKAQLSVRRESSNAKSPILNHFGAAMTGIGKYKSAAHFRRGLSYLSPSVSIRAYGAQEAFKSELMCRIDRRVRADRTIYNLNRYV